jgi:hypothetical protein
MSKQLQPLHRFQDEALKITELHDEIMGLASKALDKAQDIGGRLVKVKKGLKHGEWLPWLEASVPFSQDTANSYMRCFTNRKMLKLRNVRNLSDAYALMTGKGTQPKGKKSGKSKSSKRKTNAIAGNVDAQKAAEAAKSAGKAFDVVVWDSWEVWFKQWPAERKREVLKLVHDWTDLSRIPRMKGGPLRFTVVKTKGNNDQ